MAASAQLNVRLDPEVKSAGDSVLDLYGVSPSELIRALWAKISLGEVAFEQVVKALASPPAAGTVPAVADVSEHPGTASLIRSRQMDFERAAGLDPSTYVPLSSAELDDLVYEDYLEESREDGAWHAE